MLNKSESAATAQVTIAGSRAYAHGRVWAFDATSASLTERAAIPSIHENAFDYTIPPLTAAHFVLTSEEVAPSILVQPVAAEVGQGARVVLAARAEGTGPIAYQWRRDGLAIPGANTAELVWDNVSSADTGTYSVVISNPWGSVTSANATLTVAAAAHVAPERALVNLSTRGWVGTGDNVMIAGFYIGGSGAKRLLLRGCGPLLAQNSDLTNTLVDPAITLTTPGGTVLATNDDWGTQSNSAEVAAVMAAVWAQPLAEGSRDAALLVTLPPGGYTMILRGVGETAGIALAEIYDADPDAAAYLVNLSTRAQVGTDDALMIAGFFVEGTSPAQVLIRAAGPTLSVNGVLADPRIALTRLNGTPVAENDNWGSESLAAAEIAAVATQVYAFEFPANSLDAALVQSLPKDGYTMLVRGANTTPGVALAEIYLAP